MKMWKKSYIIGDISIDIHNFLLRKNNIIDKIRNTSLEYEDSLGVPARQISLW